jgi:5-deoxy-glucuronate isomerase
VTALITKNREGFGRGYTAITPEFGIHVFSQGERFDETLDQESAWILLDGKAKLEWHPGQGAQVVSRASLFDEGPTVLHLSTGSRLSIETLSSRAEWAVCRETNPARFEPRLFLPEDVRPEYRGKDLAQGACLRNVRQVFDLKSRPESRIVLGEVVNYPGRWSSYPPHHHDQPEIYHYRFTLPQGYGHAERGEEVFKVKSGDTLLIPGGQDHAQVSAPGYGMYYLWVVRHLDGNPYTGFEFTPEHRWILNPENQGWEAK